MKEKKNYYKKSERIKSVAYIILIITTIPTIGSTRHRPLMKVSPLFDIGSLLLFIILYVVAEVIKKSETKVKEIEEERIRAENMQRFLENQQKQKEKMKNNKKHKKK